MGATQPARTTNLGQREPEPVGRGAAALAGIVAGGVGMAAAELLAGLVPGVPSLVTAVGTLVIALQPPGAKDFVANTFGTQDKNVLNVAVVVVGLAIAAATGVLARRNFRGAAAIFAAFGALGLFGAVSAELVPLPAALLSAGVGVAAGVALLRALLTVAAGTARPASARAAVPPVDSWGRRRFLATSAGFAVAAIGGGAIGRFLIDRGHPAGVPAGAVLPITSEPVASLTPDQSLSAPGITPIVVPTDNFYRIDTALLAPQVDASTWQLRVTGMVQHPLTFTYEELLAQPSFEQYVTIACVSNKVGGNLVGNALWSGVRLKQVLEMAGVQPGATQIVGRSVDGFTVGFPTSWALDPSREPMIALGMNGAPLPAEHGYPARLIVPGLYGYVSATKWLGEIQLTTREAVDGYWIPLGWAKDGPILTQSRIDNPSDGASFAAGAVDVDGVAWAPDRGISRVEIRVDGGAWQEAELSRAISKTTWVQWMVRWQATRGDHTIEVRATDGTGAVQTADQTDPAPDGARGHHTITVHVL